VFNSSYNFFPKPGVEKYEDVGMSDSCSDFELLSSYLPYYPICFIDNNTHVNITSNITFGYFEELTLYAKKTILSIENEIELLKKNVGNSPNSKLSSINLNNSNIDNRSLKKNFITNKKMKFICREKESIYSTDIFSNNCSLTLNNISSSLLKFNFLNIPVNVKFLKSEVNDYNKDIISNHDSYLKYLPSKSFGQKYSESFSINYNCNIIQECVSSFLNNASVELVQFENKSSSSKSFFVNQFLFPLFHPLISSILYFPVLKFILHFCLYCYYSSLSLFGKVLKDISEKKFSLPHQFKENNNNLFYNVMSAFDNFSIVFNSIVNPNRECDKLFSPLLFLLCDGSLSVRIILSTLFEKLFAISLGDRSYNINSLISSKNKLSAVMPTTSQLYLNLNTFSQIEMRIEIGVFLSNYNQSRIVDKGPQINELSKKNELKNLLFEFNISNLKFVEQSENVFNQESKISSFFTYFWGYMGMIRLKLKE
jgi:hypothetical protein